jgi:hypothetical protein
MPMMSIEAFFIWKPLAGGFPEFCRRLKDRDLRSAFFELYAAKFMFQGGYEIEARPETYVKQQDFDFQAIKGSEQINVEVTALAEKTATRKTIVNALNQKRKQIPDSAPAIIFVILPEEMTELQMDWDNFLSEITKEFFYGTKQSMGTRRINAAVFVGERHRQTKNSDKGAFAFIHKSYFNSEARHQINDMNALFGWSIKSDVLDKVMNESTQIEMAEIESETEKLRNSEFYRWVDYLMPKPEARA